MHDEKLLTFVPRPDVTRGEPVLGPYFETFYLPLFGPQAIVTMRHLVRQLGDADARYEVTDLHLGKLLGMPGANADKATPTISLALRRLVKLRLIGANANETRYVVRRFVSPLNGFQVERLPFELQIRHKELMRVAKP